MSDVVSGEMFPLSFYDDDIFGPSQYNNPEEYYNEKIEKSLNSKKHKAAGVLRGESVKHTKKLIYFINNIRFYWFHSRDKKFIIEHFETPFAKLMNADITYESFMKKQEMLYQLKSRFPGKSYIKIIKQQVNTDTSSDLETGRLLLSLLTYIKLK